MKTQKDWWKYIFDERYYNTYADITGSNVTKKQVTFVLAKTKLNKGKKILDLACGSGRHALELAKRGCETIGLDYSRYLLKIAKLNSKKTKAVAHFVCGDMRNLKYENEFDLVVILFTSFGYFQKEVDHKKTLSGINKALHKNGLLFLDLKNIDFAFNKLKTVGIKNKKNKLLETRRDDVLKNGLHVTTIDSYNPKIKRWVTTRYWKEKNKKIQYTSSIRMFTIQEIKKMLMNSGFELKNIWGNYKGSIFNKETSPRIILIAKKAAN